MVRSLLLLILIIFHLQLSQAQEYSQELNDLDEYIEQARKDWEVPGMSVAVVKNGKILLAKGYGERQLGSGSQVNAQTIFNIGSTTKAITAVAMGILVDEGKLSWDDPVITHMPDFQLYDAYITRDTRVRDLFSHNLGLPNADLLWANTRHSSEEILRRMRYLKPIYPLRGGYTYQNIMYLAAGTLIERVSGSSWEDFIQERIFRPLGMKNAFPTKALSQKEANRSVAHHYHYETQEIIPISDVNADSIAAAGAIWASIEDMSKWVACMLDSSKYEGGQILKEETWAELFRPQAIIPKSQFYPSVSLTQPKWTTYGLGWFQHDYQGRAVDFHTGSLPGTIAQIGLIQKEGIGYYFLGNLDHAEVRHALMYKVFDIFADQPVPVRDWSQEFQELYESMRHIAQSVENSSNWKEMRKSSTALDLEEYSGIFEAPVWGKIEIEMQGKNLFLSYGGGPQMELVHSNMNIFQVKPNEAWESPLFVQFFLDMTGEVASLKYGSPNYTFEFDRSF